MAGGHLDLSAWSAADLCEAEEAIDGTLLALCKAAGGGARDAALAARAQEIKLGKEMSAAWKKAARTGLAPIGALVGGAPTPSRIAAFVKGLGIRLAKPLTATQAGVVHSRLGAIWKGAKRIGSREAGGIFRFGLTDKRAVAQLARQQVFWVGDLYDAHLATRIQAVATDVLITRGLPSAQAGQELRTALEQEMGLRTGGRSRFARAIPSKYAGSTDLYFRQVAATAAHQARSFGKITAFEEAGVITYKLINPQDERTGKICQQMHGQTFTVKAARQQMDAQLAATSPDDVRKAAPWLSGATLSTATGGAPAGSPAATAGLMGANASMLPPFHPLCRTEPVVQDIGTPTAVGPPPELTPGQKPGGAAPVGAPPPPAIPDKQYPIGSPFPRGLPKGISKDTIRAMPDDQLRAAALGDPRGMALGSKVEIDAARKAVEVGRQAALVIKDAMVGTPRKRFADELLKVARSDRKAMQELRRTLKAKSKLTGDAIGFVEDSLSGLPEAVKHHLRSYHMQVEFKDLSAAAIRSGPSAGGRVAGLFRHRGTAPVSIQLDPVVGRTVRVAVHETAHFIDIVGHRGGIGQIQRGLASEFVTTYATTNEMEMAAEMVERYSRLPRALARHAPERHALMDAIFSSDESYRRSIVMSHRASALKIGGRAKKMQKAREIYARDMQALGSKVVKPAAKVPTPAARPASPRPAKRWRRSEWGKAPEEDMMKLVRTSEGLNDETLAGFNLNQVRAARTRMRKLKETADAIIEARVKAGATSRRIRAQRGVLEARIRRLGRVIDERTKR